MRVIGITGGVGAGKSEVLQIIKENCDCFILIADHVAHEVMKKGFQSYEALVTLLGEEILDETQEIDHKRMAARIFAKGAGKLLKQVNAIIHPAVKSYILHLIEEKRQEGAVRYFFIEAALLIEDGYTEICDELWYIYASKEVRTNRLMELRGYSRQKVRQIMERQSEEAVFLKNCKIVINNDGDLESTKQQIIKQLGE